MRFRKDSLLFYESETAYIVISIFGLILIPMLGFGYFLVATSFFILLIFVNPKLYQEYITIDETGISCHKAGAPLWLYEWDSIAELRRSCRYLWPSIEIITHQQLTEPTLIGGCGHYFQLCKAAKEAIEKYYKPLECSQEE